MAHRLDIVDNTSDDISIAQGLLRRPRIPSRGTSDPMSPSLRHTGDGSNDASKSLAEYDERDNRRQMRSSNTWTSSSGDMLSDQDDIEDRGPYIQEYNRLARKHGVRLLEMEDLKIDNVEEINTELKSGGWFSRNILRRTSSTHSMRRSKQRRSISDLSARVRSKKDILKDKDLQELVRLCGLSRLYLPAEYAAGSLAVPTCFRATAQYLVQYAPLARGVFRIPGAHGVVTALYNHYCTVDDDGEVVAGTVRCPTLPTHIKCDVHDVASAFKKFVAGLPGGIIGSLPLFYALVSIHNQFHSYPEMTRTKQSKIRARLIALAIWTLRSQYRRELICSVFGLLSMTGRAAETARREDERGRPLPTSDLMGYIPLGIVFGPLLLGDILENYEMRLANPHGGLVLLPAGSPRSRRDRHKKSKTSEEGHFNTHVDKVKVANGVTEMLITHWRDIVRHMKDLGDSKATEGKHHRVLRPSASESFALRKPPDWDNEKSAPPKPRSVSPTPRGRSRNQHDVQHIRISHQKSPRFKEDEDLIVKKQRTRTRPVSAHRISLSRSMSYLAPTIEEPCSSDLIDFASPKPSAVHHIICEPEIQLQPQIIIENRRPSSPKKDPARVDDKKPDESTPKKHGKGHGSRQTSGDAECTVSIRVRRVISSEASQGKAPSAESPSGRKDHSHRAATPSGSTVKERKCSHKYDISDDQAKPQEKTSNTEQSSQADSAEGSRSSAMRMFKNLGTPKKKNPDQQRYPTTDGTNSSKRQSILRRSFKSEGSNTKGGRAKENSNDGPATDLPRTPKHSQSFYGVPGSARLSVRDLAAKFNTPKDIPPFVVPPTTPLRAAFDPPSVVSPYTTNTSPTKSHRSGRLEKSNPSTHKGSSHKSLKKVSSPRRVLRESADDTAHIRLNGKTRDVPGGRNSLEGDESSLKKVSSRIFSGPDTVLSPNTPSAKDKTIRTFDGHTTASPNSNLPQVDTTMSLAPLPYHVHFGAQHAVSSNDICDAGRITSSMGILDSEQRFQGPLTPCPMPPTRSNSVLHSQVRTLQKHLEAKTEQIRQLKQQLQQKGTHDIGMLSIQLQEAKREAHIWRLKADVAEKQIEVMSNISTSRRPLATKDRADHAERQGTRREESRETVLGDTTRESIQGLDGAVSAQRFSSEDSSDTVLRDFAVTSTEFDSWADQVGMDLTSQTFLEMDSRLDLHTSKLELHTHSPKLLDFGDAA